MGLEPKLTLLVGPAGCGKTHRSLEAFEEALRNSKDFLADDLLFILPTAEHRARTIDLVLRRDLPGFFQRRITAFDRALKEFLKLGGLNFATDVTRRMILKEILSQNEFQYFKEAARQAGFLELMGKMVVELKEYLVSPVEFKRRLEPLKRKFPEFEFKYADLEKIYEAYDRELKRRALIDQRDSLKLLEEGLERGEFADPKLRKVWIDGFSDFSKLQLAFIEFLTRHADEVTITLTLDDNPLRKPLFQIVSETQTALEDMGFKKTWMKSENFRTSSKTLQHLEQNLFCEEKVNQIEADSSLQIFEAAGVLGEIEMIARKIKQLVCAHRYHFSDIAVLFRTTDPYIEVIQSVFRKFQIPVEIHERLRLRNNPIARTLVSFFEILLNDWDRVDLFNFLKSSYVHTPYESICELELRALQKGIFKDREYWLSSFPEAKSFREVAHFEDRFNQLKTVHEFARWVKELMRYFGLLDFPDSSDEETKIDRSAARRILLLLEELKTKSKAWREANPKGFARELMVLMDVDLFSVHSRDKNKVQVYNVSLARQKEYKAVFLAGLLEKQFPIQVKEDPLLSDLERQVINGTGEVLKERLPRQAFERYLFYLAVTRAREHLILSYPRFNFAGKETLPSFYIEEVSNLFQGELPVKRQLITEPLPHWEDLACDEEAEEWVIKTIWSAPLTLTLSPEGRGEGEGNRLAFALYNDFLSKPRFKELIHRLLEPIEGVLTDEGIKAQFSSEGRIWSPTALEEYAECPYRYFSHRMLHLEDQTEGIDIKQRGNLLHAVLEDFFIWWKDEREKGKEVSFEKGKKRALKKFEELWSREPLRGDRYYKIELERKRIESIVTEILKKELVEGKVPIQGLTPAYFEYEFDDLVLKGEKRDIVLRGKVDRIDIDAEKKYGLVIDYKTGKKFSLKSLAKGTALQLPFYLIAVREKLGLKLIGGHLYSLFRAASSGFHHKDHMTEAGLKTQKKNRYSEKEFDELLNRSVRFAEKFVEEIEHAEIPVRPRDCVPYCPYSAVCRIEKWRLKHIYREIEKEDQEQLRGAAKV